MRPKLREDSLRVVSYSRRRNRQALCDRPGAEALREVEQHLTLPMCELFLLVSRAGAALPARTRSAAG
jgi:hypothetical protein